MLSSDYADENLLRSCDVLFHVSFHLFLESLFVQDNGDDFLDAHEAVHSSYHDGGEAAPSDLPSCHDIFLEMHVLPFLPKQVYPFLN